MLDDFEVAELEAAWERYDAARRERARREARRRAKRYLAGFCAAVAVVIAAVVVALGGEEGTRAEGGAGVRVDGADLPAASGVAAVDVAAPVQTPPPASVTAAPVATTTAEKLPTTPPESVTDVPELPTAPTASPESVTDVPELPTAPTAPTALTTSPTPTTAKPAQNLPVLALQSPSAKLRSSYTPAQLISPEPPVAQTPPAPPPPPPAPAPTPAPQVVNFSDPSLAQPAQIVISKSAANAHAPEPSEPALDYLIKQFERSRSVYFALEIAEAFLRQNDYQSAILWALRANEINDDLERSWVVFARAKAALGEREQAARALENYLAKHPDAAQSAELLNNLKTGK